MKQFGKAELSAVLYLIFAVVVVLIAVLALKLPVVTVVLVVVIEAGLSICMHKVPLWLHVAVIVAELALGIFTKNVIFLILGAALYFAGVIALSFRFRKSEKKAA